MSDKLKREFFFVAPLEVVRVTSENMEEVAEWCGGKVATTQSKKYPDRTNTYVWVPTPKGSTVSWAYPGMFITRRLAVSISNELKHTYSVFRGDYFEKNYFETPQEAVDATWERELREKSKRQHPASRMLENRKTKSAPPSPADIQRMMGGHETTIFISATVEEDGEIQPFPEKLVEAIDETDSGEIVVNIEPKEEVSREQR